MKNIPITKTLLGDEEVTAIKECLESGWLVQGPRVAAFEQEWSTFTNSPYTSACTSCTTALHLALLALGIGPGDEVIVPAFTWIATANAVEYCGATPVFADVTTATFNIDVNAIEEKISDKTACILPVHLFGLCADMQPIMELAKAHNLAVVEDCACALGSYYQEKHAGTIGNAGCFSLHPRKSITTGEGGMVTLQDAEHARIISVLRSHGAEITDRARHEGGSHALPEFKRLGFNYRMTDIQAALGSVQLTRATEIIRNRIEKARIYTEAFKSFDELQTPFTHKDYIHSYQSYVLFVKSSHARRDEIAKALQEKGIATRQGTHAVHMLDYYARKYSIKADEYKAAKASDEQSLCIPLYPQMAEDEQAYVIESLTSVL